MRSIQVNDRQIVPIIWRANHDDIVSNSTIHTLVNHRPICRDFRDSYRGDFDGNVSERGVGVTRREVGRFGC